MATLLLWLGFEPAAIDEGHWQAMETRALARAPGTASRLRTESLRALCINHRAGAPTPLRMLADGECLLADIAFETSAARLIAGAQDTPAAVIHAQPRAGRLRLLRDRLGQRPLVWTRLRDGVLVASGEHILRAHPQVAADWDEDYLAAYFGAAAPPATATAYRAIHTLAPGECLDLDARRSARKLMPLEPDESAPALSPSAAAARLRALLEAAVAQEASAATRVGISLSAGLDSCSIAALLPPAVRREALAISYGCDRLRQVDERPLAAALAQHLELEHQGFAVDDLAPLMPAGERPVCADTPVSNPYREIKSALYQHARAGGVDVLLTGHFGDHLQPGNDAWLPAAWRQRALGQIVGYYTSLWRRAGVRAVWRERSWRTWLARPKATAAPWLRPDWQARLLQMREQRLAACRHWPQPAQAAHALGSYAAIDAAGEAYFSARFGIEVRHPYRSLELVRFALSLPAHICEREGLGKWVVREALRGCLPDTWRLRPKSVSMQPLFEASVCGSERQRVHELIEHGRAHWSAYLDPATAAGPLPPGDGESQDLLRWLLVGFGLWMTAQG